MEKDRQRAVREVTLPYSNGAILRVSIWRHQSRKEPPRYSISVCNGYQTKDGEWVFSAYFSRDELHCLSRIAKAYGCVITSETSGGADNE